MNILHLSDIHFGRELDPTCEKECTQSNKIQESLCHAICSLNTNEKPDYILVTGDVAWKGKKQEFHHALSWFKALLNGLNLSPDKIMFCPGNHDIDWTAGVPIKRKDRYTPEELDEIYRYDNMTLYDNQIQNYNEFCFDLDVSPYQYEIESNVIVRSYSVGYRDIDGLRIISFNTAIMSKLLHDKPDMMWLGNSQVKELFRRNIFHQPQDLKTKCIISLFHHAPRYLDPNAVFQYDNRHATLLDILDGSDLALCGHTETGASPFIVEYQNHGKLINGGAAYYNDEHPNSFSIIQIDHARQVGIIAYQYSRSEWSKIEKADYNDVLKDVEIRQEISQPEIWVDVVYQGAFFRMGRKIHRKCTLELDSGEKSVHIPLGCIEVVPEQRGSDLFIYSINNDIDVNRFVNFRCLGNSNGKFTTNIRYPHGRRSSVEACLWMEKYFFLMQEAKRLGMPVKMTLKASNGSRFIEAGDISDIMTDHDEDIEIKIRYLEVLRNFETKYGVLFSPKFDEGIHWAAIEVIDKLNNGESFEVTGDADIHISIVVDSVDVLMDLVDASEKEQPIQFVGAEQCVLHYAGVDVKLSDIVVETTPLYIKDIDDLRQKHKTFCEGDLRSIDFSSKIPLLFRVTNIAKFKKDDSAYLLQIPHDLMCKLSFVNGLLTWI